MPRRSACATLLVARRTTQFACRTFLVLLRARPVAAVVPAQRLVELATQEKLSRLVAELRVDTLAERWCGLLVGPYVVVHNRLVPGRRRAHQGRPAAPGHPAAPPGTIGSPALAAASNASSTATTVRPAAASIEAAIAAR